MEQYLSPLTRIPTARRRKLGTCACLCVGLAFLLAGTGMSYAGCDSAAIAVEGQVATSAPALTFESVPRLEAGQHDNYSFESHPASFSATNGAGLSASGGQTDLSLSWFNIPRLYGGCESMVTIENFALIVPGSVPDVPLLSITGKISTRATEYGRCPEFPPFDTWSHSTFEGFEVSVDGVAVSLPSEPAPNTIINLSGRLSGATLTLNERSYSGGTFAITSLHLRSNLEGVLSGDVAVAATRVNAICGTPVSLQSFSVD